MNKALYFILGAAIGAVSCYTILKNKLVNEFDEKLKEAVQDYKDSKAAPDEVESEEKEEEPPVEQRPTTVSYSAASPKTDYEAKAEHYVHPENVVEHTDYDPEDRVPPGWDDNGNIRHVEQNEYDMCDYSKTLYEVYEDGVIIDTSTGDSVELEEIEHFMGYDPVNTFDYDSVYILNDKLEEGYCLEVLPERYENLVGDQ